MKHLLRLAALLGLLILTGCPKPDPIPTSDKLLHLAFDGSTYDSASHHYSVHTSGRIRYARDRYAHNNSAILLDGSQTISVLQAPALDFSGASSYSISVWICTGDTSNASILSKGSNSNAAPGYSLQLINGRPAAIFTGVGDPIQIKGSKSIADYSWHLITVTVSNDSILLYADTNIVARTAKSSIASQASAQGPLRIGSATNGKQKYKGLIDNVIIWPTALSSGAIAKLREPGEIINVVGMGDMPPGVATPYHGILDVCWVGSGAGFACGTYGLLFKSSASTWTQLQPQSLPGGAHWRRVSFCSANVGALLDHYGNLYVSTDGASSWDNKTPVFGSNEVITGIHSVDNHTLVIVGYGHNTSSGGDGFIAKFDPDDPSQLTYLEQGNVPGYEGIAASGAGSSTLLWAIGGLQIRRYNLQSTAGQDIALSTTDDLQSADFTAQTDGFTGLVGTRTGKVFQYSETTNQNAPPQIVWTDYQVAPATDMWIVGVRDGSAGNRWAVTSGLENNIGKSRSTRRPATGSWLAPSSLAEQTAIVWTNGTSTYAIPANATDPLHGLPGILINPTSPQR